MRLSALLDLRLNEQIGIKIGIEINGDKLYLLTCYSNDYIL